MAGVTPDKLRQAANMKSAITTPTAEGAKDTTIEVAKGAVKGAATGGWVGAARGAAVSFAQTKAGRRVIAIVLSILLVILLSVPVGLFIVLNATASAASYGDQFRAGEAAAGSGNENTDVSAAMTAGRSYGIQWPIILAMETVVGEEKTQVDRLAEILNRGTVRTLGAGGTYVSGLGLVAGKSDSEKAAAASEKEHYVSSLTEYGLTEAQADKVYTIALKWAFGQMEECSIPGDLGPAEPSTITTSDGKEYKLDETQIGNIQSIVKYASKVEGITPDAIQIILMAAAVESNFRNYANSSVPDSLNYPHDAVGSDHDSVGFWQMRQHWGTTAELMDIEYQVKAILGGPNGPNKGSPRGLFDIKGWDTMPKGEAAQAVEVSAFPDRYAERETLAEELLKMFGAGMSFCDGGLGVGGGGHPMGDPSAHIVVSGYGPRTPGAGSSNHKGIDFQAGCDTPIYAVADGTVIHDGPEGGWGNSVVIDHGSGLVTRSAHMPHGGKWAKTGTQVKKGDQIGTVGTTGDSSGCHLHFETKIDGKYNDPAVVLTELGVKLIWHPRANGIPAGAELAW